MRSGEHIASHLSGVVCKAPIDFATWKDRFPHHIEIAENRVSDACRYRDALPRKMEIERTATATTIAAMKISD